MSSLSSLLNNEYAVGNAFKITVVRVTDLKTRRSAMADVHLTLIEAFQETVTGQRQPSGQNNS